MPDCLLLDTMLGKLAGRAPDAVVLESHDVTDQLRELAEAGFVLALAGL